MDNVTIYGLATLGTGLIGLAIRYSFKSKCEDVSLCFGFVKIHRNTEDEVKAETMELQHQPPIIKQESIGNLNSV